MKVKSDHCSKFSNLSNWKEEACKNQGFNGIGTHDFPANTGAMLDKLSYEATHWEQGQFIEFISSHAVNYSMYMSHRVQLCEVSSYVSSPVMGGVQLCEASSYIRVRKKFQNPLVQWTSEGLVYFSKPKI